jgi:dihydroxyacid dehydratase/phosphogluconate dehydratase
MRGAADAAMVILKGGPMKKGRHSNSDNEEEIVMEEEEEEVEEDEYSDLQMEMADELQQAIANGDQEKILHAIHGIMMSYQGGYE